MTTDEINIAIAEACGWVRMPDGPDYLPPKSLKTQTPPSYTTDLNACHEMEKILTIHNYAEYEIELCRAQDSTGKDSDVWHYVLCATARQRAEAFLRTLGKWKD